MSILGTGFRYSRNEYDWLGDGVYFFQDAPLRAREWATRRYGDDAAVIGSVIRLEGCIDLLDIGWVEVLTEAFEEYQVQQLQLRQPLPRQSTGARRLDRAVVNYVVDVLAEAGEIVRTVRSTFSEGRPIFPDSALLDRSHVQVVVRDMAVVEDVWLI